MCDTAFRKWVESLPDKTWAKKDLSACRLGWDAALNAFYEELSEKNTIRSGTQRYVAVHTINECFEKLQKGPV